MVRLSIRQSEERWGTGKTCHCGICFHGLFISWGEVFGNLPTAVDDFLHALEDLQLKQRMVMDQKGEGLKTGNVWTGCNMLH